MIHALIYYNFLNFSEEKMKMQYLKSFLLTGICLSAMASASYAITIPPGYSVSSDNYWTSSQSDSDFKMTLRVNDSAGYFGIYSIDENGTLNKVNLFSDTDQSVEEGIYDGTSTYTAINIFFGTDGTLSVYKDSTLWQTVEDFGTVFGFFQNVQEVVNNQSTYVDTWYSDESLNSDGEEHIIVLYQGGETYATDNAIIFALPEADDLASAVAIGRYEAYDMSPVPEPATLVLFGTGLLGLASAARKRRQ